MNPPQCPEEFTGPVRAGIIDAIRGAYAEADEVYAPDRGRGDHLHALAVYHVACFRLRLNLEGMPGVFVVSRGQGPELRIGSRNVRWNKVGRGDGGDTINNSFPRSSKVAAIMARENNQTKLFSDDMFDDDTGSPTNWIIAHLGNARDGLMAIYFAAPMATDGVRVTGWREIIPIWSAVEPDVEFPRAPAPGLPESIELDDLPIELIQTEPSELGDLPVDLVEDEPVDDLGDMIELIDEVPADDASDQG
jgi:hypothetical protein